MIDGQLVVTTTQKVIQVDPATSRHTVLANTTTGAGPTLGLAASVAVEATGQLLIADSSLGAIIRVDPGTGDRTLVSDANTGGGPTLSRPQSIAVAPDGQLFVLDYEVIGLPSGVALEENRVLRVDPITGNRTLVSDGCGSGQLLTSIAIETAGTLVLVDPEGTAVWRVDPSTGNCTIVSSKLGDSDIFSEVGTGPGFRAPRGIAVEATGHLVVLDPQRTAVLRIETSTGDRTLVSDVGTGRGPLFSSLGPVVLLGVGIRPAPVLFALNDGIAVEASGHLVVMDPVLNAVIRVDTSSGDRAIIAK
jgi:DNA-binding beta-propeller fold protein YncE